MSEPGPPSAGSEMDVYTILMAVAAMFLLVATVIMSIRSQQLFGGWLPFGGA